MLPWSPRIGYRLWLNGGRFLNLERSEAAGAEFVVSPHGVDALARWRRGNETVVPQYEVHKSPLEARATLRASMRVLPVPTRRITGLGDEAYVVAPVNPSNERVVNFTRGVMLFEVRAPGDENVREFDEHVGRRLRE